MSERYQIKAKIGQGGIGAVYRAFDTHLQREVAVKRLLPPDETEAFDDDPSKSLFKEAHLLSALQHPNVVSVYDVGSDADGMFVVMELVDGETFDQVVDRGLLTEDDFAEMVAQTLEALIAAQDKALVHRDIKPTNLMVKWLPSGKFQFKLLDFGLAKFSPKPSQQTIGLNDAILGSIHFMAPEQFERLPLDGRTDLYAMGCMYYYGLTGRYPFDGDTAAEVMAAHLSHRLTPMEEIRPDLTRRTCEWVMWLMSRDMTNRPSSAQEALEIFFNPELGIPGAHVTPRLIIPGAAVSPRLGNPATPPASGKAPSSPVRLGSGPIRTGSGPVRPVSGQVRLSSSPVRLGGPASRPGSAPVRAGSSSVRPVSSPIPDGYSEGEQMVDAVPQAPQAGFGHHHHPAKSPAVKWAIISVISAVVIIGVAVVMNSGGSKKQLKQVIEIAESSSTSGSGDQVRLLAPYLTPTGELPADQAENLVGKVLGKLEEMEGPDVDAAIVAELKKSRGKVQTNLIKVVVNRKQKDAMDVLPAIATGEDESNAKAALEAISVLGETRDAETVVDVLCATKSGILRNTAENVLQVLIDKAVSKNNIVPFLEKAVLADKSKEVQQAGLRLLGKTGSPAAASAIDLVLKSGDADLKLAAITALRDWPNDGQLDRLASLATTGVNDAVKTTAYEAFVRTLSLNQDRNRPPAKLRAWWGQAELLATTRERKNRLLTGISVVPETFALEIATKLQADPDPSIRSMATEARNQIQKFIAEKGKTNP